MKTLPLLCTTGIVIMTAIAGCESPAGTDIDDVTMDYVVDGDTIRAIVDGNSERIRLLGIDTPEIGRDGTPDERCAREARQFLADSMTDATVTLSTDPHSPERDQYDRILAYVEVDGVDVGQTMLAEGFADLYTGNQDLLRWSNYTDTYRDRAEPQCTDSTSH